MDIRPRPDGLNGLVVTAAEYDAAFEVDGNCPVQGFGTVLGRDLYFHARHDRWFFEVADSAGNMPSDGYHDSDGFYREHDYSDAGWMPLPDAVAIIELCLREYASISP